LASLLPKPKNQTFTPLKNIIEKESIETIKKKKLFQNMGKEKVFYLKKMTTFVMEAHIQKYMLHNIL